MVFESLVADLLNRYLGEYVDNLDRSQLKIGIWGGDVVLKDLRLKQSALDELDLPVKTISGFLGKLTLKIPWKNVYNASTEASIENLFILVAPNTEMKYDPAKEEKWKQEAKQAEVEKVEAAKKREREKDKEKPPDTFVEKMATQIVRNVQIYIKDIHIRYEDRVSKANGSFAFGITLHDLSVITTDENWLPAITQGVTAMIYKTLKIEGLSVYMNTNCPSYFDLSTAELHQAFREGIATKDILAKGFQYVLGPINATSKLRINSKPETDGSGFTVPKILFNLELQKLLINIGKTQYQDIMVLLDSMDRMARAAPYRKYRPNVKSYAGHYKEWWHFAYTSILEEEIRRRRKNWDWIHIRKHRKTCNDYAKAYQTKLVTAKPPADVVQTCQQCEKELDVLNIVLIRQKIEVEVERRGLLDQAKKEKQGGWFSGWWSSSPKAESSDKVDIMKQFEEAMTPEEKQKLFRAIDYQENAAPAEYPVEFVAVDLNFVLHSLVVEVRDDACSVPRVLLAALQEVSAKCEQRPAGQAIKVSVSMQQFSVTGLKQGELLPKLAQTKSISGDSSPEITSKDMSQTSKSRPLLDIMFETNPLDKQCDQRIYVTSRPLEFIYDAQTINKVLDVFTTPQNTVITQIQTAANLKLAEFKEKSALGIQYAIQKHTKLDLKVDLMGCYGVLPHGGLYTGESQTLVVVNLGSIIFNSKPKRDDELNVKKMHLTGTKEEEIMKEMMRRSYDRFVVELKHVQVMVVLPGEKWQIQQNSDSDQYLLQPSNLTVKLAKCLFTDDPRLPKVKIEAQLPNINLKIEEKRLMNLLALLVSIPFPESSVPEIVDTAQNFMASTSSLKADLERASRVMSKSESKKSKVEPEDELVQFTELEIKFNLNEVSLSVFAEGHDNHSVPLCDFHLLSIEAEMIQQTYDLNIQLRLGGLSLHQDYEHTKINVLNTPMAEGEKEYLFIVKFCKVDRESPEFHSKHGSVVQLIDMNFSRLNTLVHQEALLQALQWMNKVQAYIADITNKGEEIIVVPPPVTTKPSLQKPSATQRMLSTIIEEGNTRQSSSKKSARILIDTIDLKLRAHLGEISVTIRNKARSVGKLLIKGGETAVIMKRSYTQVDAKLVNMEVIDLRPDIKHNKVLSILGSSEALTSQVVMFNEEVSVDSDNVNMSVTANVACFRVVFLNYFLMSLLDFLNQFQAAQEAILEASAAAATAARANVQEAYNSAFKMRLNIQLKAPIILIPANSQSHDAVLVDFGVLTMNNTLQDLPVKKNGDEYNAVLDHLQLGLQNLKVSRVKLGPTMDVINECPLLQPISFKLSVQRNLSSSWFTEIPDLDVSGRLESIHVTLSQEDYTMIMRVLAENLGESLPEKTETASVSQAKPTSLKRYGSKMSLATVETKQTPSSAETPEDQKSPETVHQTIKFSFTLESLIIELYSGGSKEMEGKISPQRLPENGLARFTLFVLSLKGSMLSDNSLSTSLLLLDCLLDDTRSSQANKINRYMERKPDDVPRATSPTAVSAGKAPNKRSMIDITYQQKNNTSFVDMRVYSFLLILNMEHLMKVADFATSGLQEAATMAEANKSARNVSTVSKDAPVAAVDDNKMMTVSVKVEKPDIIVVENMDDINTNAIIMHNEIQIKLRMTGSHMVLNGHLKDLQLFSCCYNPAKRKETKAQILRPITINVAGSTPSGEGLHLDVCTTDIRLSVSPGTIELLNKVMATITAPKVDIDEGAKVEKDYSDLWDIQPFRQHDYWFLKTELADDATHITLPTEAKKVVEEICLVAVPSVVITLEAGVGNKTVPMLLVESSLQATINNWSSQLNVDSVMTLQLAYYNNRLALWEPLVEPVETGKSGNTKQVPWELQLQVETNDPTAQEELDNDGVEALASSKPKMVVSILSKETLEMTVTKTCLEVLQNLGVAFNNAIFQPQARTSEVSAPYVVQNDLGLAITVMLKDSEFKIFDDESETKAIKEVVLESGARVNLCLIKEDDMNILIGQGTTVKEKYLQIKVIERNCELDLPVARADKRFFSLQHRVAGNDPWGLVSDVQVQDGSTLITLRSIIQIHNHFTTALSVFFMTKKGNEVQLVGTVEAGKQLNLPLQAIYTPTNELFFSVEGHTVSIAPFVWKDLQKSLAMTKLLQCNSKNVEDKEPFFIKAVGEIEQVYFELSNRHTMASTCYNIHLRPTVVLKNFLPVEIVCCLQGVATEITLKPGDHIQIPTAEPGMSTVVVRIPDYLEKEWSCKHEISANPSELSVWTFESYDSAQRMVLDLGMHSTNKDGSLVLALYCPFWMLNKTGLMVSYRRSSKAEKSESGGNPAEQSDDSSNVLYHPENFKGPVMFSFRAKNFFGKKKSCIKVKKGEWSDKFSLDVAGSSGVVNCKADNRIYQVGVDIKLTYNSLTKQVTFTPYHVLINRCSIAVEVQEHNQDFWIRVEAGECTPFWPHTTKSEEEIIKVRPFGTKEFTSLFHYNKALNILLKLPNKYGAIYVDVQTTEGAKYITFCNYEAGMAPALIVNHTNYDIPISEKDVEASNFILKPDQKVMFAWSRASDNNAIVWCNKYSDELRKDGIGKFSVSPSVVLYWITFLDGLQRILLFTSDPNIQQDTQMASNLEVFDQEIQVSIHGAGLSLVDNISRTEVLYLGITSSGVIWETRKSGNKRYKQVSTRDNCAIEEAYMRYQQALQVGSASNVSSQIAIHPNLEVDFATNVMFKPHNRQMRRTYNQGLWLQLKSSPHQRMYHAKINRLQIDNQMYDCVFPVVLAPVPPPKSVNVESVAKPFVEVSIVERVNEHSPVKQYQYFKALIQEFHVKVDIGFINAIFKLIEADAVTDEQEAELFQKDCTLVDEPLMSHVSLVSSQEQKNFYDILHFSPLKMHVSFSLSGGGPQAQSQSLPPVLNVLMQSLGVTLTDIQDVVFKLSYFERNYTFLNHRQLLSEVQYHYVGQLVKQLYVLVLGLDVIGNPFGLVIGLTEGVQDLFYEPFQGAIQGPGEFAEGLVLGIRSMFGHTVGGAAGAVSRITGAMGKGLAALTFDEDYQRKRREQMNYRPSNVQEGIAQSGKGLVMGVVEGVGGVFTKPISGAKQEGVEGFFKGVGKGVVGLVTRPTAGVIDFASGSFNAVKRVTEMGEEVTRLRHPRYFKADGLVRPYSKLEAEGNKILKELEKGKYYATDLYIYHSPIGTAKCKDILLLTDKRIAVLSHNEIFGGNQIEFAYTWGELIEPPTAVPKGIQIRTGEGKKKMGLFKSSEHTKVILVENQDLKQFILQKINALLSQRSTGTGTGSRSNTST